MDFGFFIIVVAIAAMVYSLIIKEIQFRLTDQAKSKALQAKSKELSEELKKASAKNDQKKINEIMQKQLALMGEMNSIMLQSLKAMVPIIIVFLFFTSVLTFFDPTTLDDINLDPLDDGNDCDKTANDKNYSICYKISGNSGEWLLSVKALDGKNLIGQDNIIGETHKNFFLDNLSQPTNVKPSTGQQILVQGVNSAYKTNDLLELHLFTNKGIPKVTLNNGTWFYVDLPFTIPILNVQRINDVYWWFIFVAFIFGLISNTFYQKLRKAV